jgi:RHS repeat-associated protein
MRHSQIGSDIIRSVSYYLYDGHGSTRALADTTGNVTDTYDYDAFGNEIHATGATPNEFLFAGEQYDSDLRLYYNRARYLNTSTGRFWTMDSVEGDWQSPLSLHKYLYASADPVNRIDPSGNDDLAELSASFTIAATISSMSNVVVAAIYSAVFNGLPDAVGFGAFVSGGFGNSFTLGGIFAYEVVYAPRLKEEATYLFYGGEGSTSAPLVPSLDPTRIFHSEAGAFVAWYWNLHDLDTDVFGVVGPSVGGGFLGVEVTLKSGTKAILSGVTTDTDWSVFTIVPGFETKLTENGFSKGAMISQAAALDAAFTSIGVIRGGGVNAIGGLAAAIVNASATGLWINHTYGEQH